MAGSEHNQAHSAAFVPAEFLLEKLPAMQSVSEIKLAIYLYWRRARLDAGPLVIEPAQLRQDDWLKRSLGAPGVDAALALDQALESLQQLAVIFRLSSEQSEYVVLADQAGRQAVDAFDRGEWTPAATEIDQLERARRNIFVLYEQNFGPLTPLLAERLIDAESEYPAEWIREAMGIALENNVRKWRYVLAILDGWKSQGRHERDDRGRPEEARRRYIQGEFSDHIEH